MLLEKWPGRAMPAVQKIGIHQVAPTLAATLPSGLLDGLDGEHGLLVVLQLGVQTGAALVGQGRFLLVTRRLPTARGKGSSAVDAVSAKMFCCEPAARMLPRSAGQVSVLCRKRAWLGS